MKNLALIIVLICTTFNFAQAQRTKTLTPKGEQTYIVTLKADQNKRTADASKLRAAKSRDAVGTITKRMGDDFKRQVTGVTQKLNISPKKVKGQFANLNMVTMTLTAKEAQVLKDNSEIISIEADQQIQIDLPKPEGGKNAAPQQKSGANNRSFSDHYGAFNINHGGHKDGGGSKYTWIWIIDTGIDLDHPDLNVQTSSTYAKSFIPGDTSPNDCHGHGTHVAGIAAAKRNNSGMVGMSEGAKVVPVRIMDCPADGRPTYPTSRLIAALNHVATGVISGDVVNMSIGGGGSVSTSLKAALDALTSRGVLLSIAAGNSSSHAGSFQPAAYNNTKAVTISSMDANGTMSNFSNYGMNPVDFIATGRSVYSTFINGGYATMSGTSMAAPVVAGIMHARGGLPSTYGTIRARGESYPVAGLGLTKGTNAKRVGFGNGTSKIGDYINTSGSSWQEIQFNGKKFNFVEQNRDEWSVYLKDNSRNVYIQLDLHRKKVRYNAAGQSPVDLYNNYNVSDAN